jgi:predicted metal-binding protein
MTMKELKPYLKIAVDQGVDDALIVETAKVFTAPWVRMKCQFGCHGYGKSLCCPPHTPTPEEMRKVLDSYQYAILFHGHSVTGFKATANLNDVILKLERVVFLDGYYKAWALTSGPCNKCKACDPSGRCVHPDKARPSLESCGIDVYRTAREHGLPIQVVKDRDQAQDYYGLVLVD